SESARRRFGIELPYEEQFDWGITRLKPKQLEVCIAETHTDEAILAGRPYPGAVEAVTRWHEAGHFIHITSHRDTRAHDATERWLRQIGLPFDELYCSFDKVTRCCQIGIDVLIDDSPINISRAIDAGIVAATLSHPWNADVCDEEDVVCARDWPELERKLTPLLTRAAA
ncbi:MAG TPA: hypothetical protein VFR97_02960, partial [Capillimicrobium sp.]|nr:hypothetical protein [Capillimicrobium sp.]